MFLKEKIIEFGKRLSTNQQLLDTFGAAIRWRLPSMIRVFRQYPAFDNRFLELTEQGGLPAKVVTHFNHLDPVGEAVAADKMLKLAAEHGLEENLNGFAVTLASSVGGGQQSPFLQGV